MKKAFKRKALLRVKAFSCAREGTRTPIPFRGLAPETSASTNFATRAFCLTTVKHHFISEGGKPA